MTEAKFTWFPKLTVTVAKVPEDQRGAILWALAQYGTFGVEPELEWPLDAMFEALRDCIDSKKRPLHPWRSEGAGRKPLPPRVRYEVLERDGYTCQYCGAKAPDVALHVDHIVPVAEGGTDDIGNLVTACEYCNTGKGSLPTSRFSGGETDG